MSQPSKAPIVRRWLTRRVQEAAANHPVLVLTGARQVGKSTLLRAEKPFADWRYLSFDDLSLIEQARTRPEALWAGVDEVVLDEVQKAPEVLPAVKLAVDASDRRRRFVLSGSANLMLMQQVSESLAGRAIYMTLEPMALGEWTGEAELAPVGKLDALLSGDFPADQEVEYVDPLPHLLRGFLPALLPLQSIAEKESRNTATLRWWEGYVATYLERDLRQLSQVSSLVDFRKLMELLALRSGNLLNQSELGRDARLPQSTVNRYLNLLESSHLFQRLPAYASSHATLLKSPRVFWSDPALAAFLAGYFDLESLRKSRELGFFFETLVFLHLRIVAAELAPRAKLFSWRTAKGEEVDFVVEHGRRLIGVEVKMAPSVSHRDAANLRLFLNANPGAAAGILLHSGTEIRRLDEKIIALPWTWLSR